MSFARLPSIAGLLLLALVTACAAPPLPQTGFRDPAAPFASTSRFDADRFTGDWVRIAAFAPPQQVVAPASHSYRRATTGQILGYVTAADGVTRREVYDVTAPGRLRPQGQTEQAEELWLIWVDEGFRTAVLGTPSGSRAFILDRSATPAPDRLRAAREILDWYGYDLSRLQNVK